ncbi:MAG: ZIP family metal transporter [Candidatus Woesearchaeota archaeon]
MIPVLLSIIVATVVVSLMSLVGLALAGRHMHRWLHYLISFAAGTLLAVAFFGLMPSAMHGFEELGLHAPEALVYVVAGIVLFFLIERFIHWHHCGKEDCGDKPAGLLVLTGDFVHNFIDGVLIAGAFLLDPQAGWMATLSILAHEIPQEVGDFSVLLHAGFSKARALLLNFYSALSAVLGGVIGYFALDAVEGVVPYVVAVAAGGFVYIALSDIMPALHKHKKETKLMVVETLIFLVTVVAFWFLLSGHAH